MRESVFGIRQQIKLTAADASRLNFQRYTVNGRTIIAGVVVDVNEIATTLKRGNPCRSTSTKGIDDYSARRTQKFNEKKRQVNRENSGMIPVLANERE